MEVVCECELRCPAEIAGQLAVQDIFQRDSLRESARADNFDSAGKLAHEHRAGKAVITMGHGVQEGLANSSLVEGWNVHHEQSILIVLLVIAPVYPFPKMVEEEQEYFADLFALVGWAAGFG